MYQRKQISLLHLATHTSGLPRNRTIYRLELATPIRRIPVEQLYRFSSYCKPRQAPGLREKNIPIWECITRPCHHAQTGKDTKRWCSIGLPPSGVSGSTRNHLTPGIQSGWAINTPFRRWRDGFSVSPRRGWFALHGE